MRQRKRGSRRALLPAIALAALAMAAPAEAGVSIRAVDTSAYPEVRVTVVAPAGSTQPVLDENGAPVVGLQAANLGRSKSVVLAVDRSQSMEGRSLAAATDAGRLFVATKNANDRVEVIAFGRRANTLSPFSSVGAEADAALSEIAPDPHSGTALWDAVVQAAAALRHESTPGHVIILVTDGSDVSSSATLADAVAAARRARATVYAVGIHSRDFRAGPLQQLTRQTGGTFLETSSAAGLAALYGSIAQDLTHTWELSYATAARPGQRIRIDASVPGVGSSARSLVLDDAAAAAPTAPSLLPASVWRSSMAPLVLAAAVGLLMFLALASLLRANSANRLSTRLAPHLGPTRTQHKARRSHDKRLLRRLSTATEHVFANIKQFRALQRVLARADLPLLAAELLYLSLGLAVGLGLVLGVAGAPPLVVVAVMLCAGAVPVLWAGAKARTRMKAFDEQLPDLLLTIAASLKAGHSFRHAIQAVVDEGAEPASKEFRRVLNETRLGRPMDDALSEMGDRIRSSNLTFVLTSVTIQRQIGGSLSGLFDMVAETVRQRQQFARKVRGLTAMGRMSAYVLVGLPILVGLALTALNPSYMQPLWQSSTGHELLTIGLTMLVLGAAILKRIVSFRG